VNFYYIGLKLMSIRKNIIRISSASESENVRVFEEKQLLGRFTRAQPVDCSFLQSKAFIVRNNA